MQGGKVICSRSWHLNAKVEVKSPFFLFTLLFWITREVGLGKGVLCVETNIY